MIMLVNKEKIKTERLNRAWSQAQLAEASGIGLRTIQRIEAEGKSSLESAKGLASVFCLSVTELYLNEADDLCQSYQQQTFQYCSAKAKTFIASVFLISAIILLFLQWSQLPGLQWVNELRDHVFSEQLAVWLKSLISSSIIILITLIFSVIIGITFDAVRNEGFYASAKSQFQAGNWSGKKMMKTVCRQIKSFSRATVKPVMITIVFFIIVGSVIYLDMEEYQKSNLVKFLNQQ